MKDDNLPDPVQIFRHVFKELQFPYLSADPVALAEFLAHPRASEGCHVVIDFPFLPADRRDVALSAFSAFITTIDPPDHFKALLCSSPAVRNTQGTINGIRAVFSDGEPNYAVQSVGTGLRWDEVSPWPATYRHFLSHMAYLIEGYAMLLQRRRDSLAPLKDRAPGVSVADQSSRLMPTRHHYAAASLGAWAGGALNFQFFAYFATQPLIDNPSVNTDYGLKVDYNLEEAEALTNSGIAVVPATLFYPLQQAQGDFMHFGGLPINEFNAVNLPEQAVILESITGPDVLPGLLVEANYRAPFIARKLGTQGLLGREEVLRDHYAEFYANTSHVDLLRCKHYCAPIIEVGSVAELDNLARSIPQRAEEGVFFRGQGTLHTLKRDPRVRSLLFGESTRLEPSLVTSAVRKGFDYDSLHFAIKYFIQETLFGEAGASAIGTAAYETWIERSKHLRCDIDYAVMALAQHYGLPSHGLDVTTDLDVATWFATNKWVAGPPASYTTLRAEDWPTEASKWPVVFACQQVTNSLGMSRQDCFELEEFGLKALRPSRQKASFFLGGHSDHQNRLAETVVCAFRLRPGNWPTAASFPTLFPSPEEDAAYAAMLRFAERPEFASLGAQHVARYH